MAIQFARLEYVSRSTGGNSCRKSAYNAREEVKCDRTGELFDFSKKTDNVYHTVLLPMGAHKKFKESSVLWNEAELCEKRINSQVCKDVVIALPDENFVSLEDKIELTERFITKHFVSKGLAAQIDIHAPHESEKNWHAHILVTTRRFDQSGDHLGEKARDLDVDVRFGKVYSLENLGYAWKEEQNAFFKEKGLDICVDPTSVLSEDHLGPVRMRRVISEVKDRSLMLKKANEELVRDVDVLLQKMTHSASVFNEKDLNRFLQKHVLEHERSPLKEKVLGHESCISLYDAKTFENLGLFTTLEVKAEEEKLHRFAKTVHEGSFKPLKDKTLACVIQEKTLTKEQEEALRHITSSKGLSIVEGRAGVGKSHLLSAFCKSYKSEKRSLIGLAPTHAVAKDLSGAGFENATTVHSFLFKAHNNRINLQKGTVVVVDEAAMLSNSTMVELLHTVKQNHFKLVLVGDDKQLSSIERGGSFCTLIKAFGSKQLNAVRRQEVHWQKEVSMRLGEGQTKEALEILNHHEAIVWSDSKQTSLEVLLESLQTTKDLENTFVLASKNEDVDILNRCIRQMRLEKGEIGKDSFAVMTKRGAELFSINDKVILQETNKDYGLKNGDVAFIKEISSTSCTLLCETGKDITLDPRTYLGLRLGYASTIHKAQGKTLKNVMVLHDKMMGRQISYVALSRQTQDLKLFVSKDETKSIPHLAFQMERDNTNTLSTSFLTSDEVAKKIKEIENPHENRGFLEKATSLVTSKVQHITTKVKDRFHQNKDFYDTSHLEKKDSSVHQVKKVDMESFKSPLENVPDVLRLQAIERLDIHLDAFKSEVHREPTLKELNALEERACFETLRLEKNIVWMTKHGYEQAFQKAYDPSQDTPLVHTMAEKLNLLEGSLFFEKALKNEAVDHATLKKAARGEFFINVKNEQDCIRLSLKEEGNPSNKEITQDISLKTKGAFSSSPKPYGTLVEVSLDQIKSELQARIGDLAIEFFGKPSSRSSHHLRFGKKGSVCVTISGKGQGGYANYETGQYGNAFSMIENQLGVPFKDAVVFAKEWLGYDASSYEKNWQPQRPTSATPSTQKENTWTPIFPVKEAYPDLKTHPHLRHMMACRTEVARFAYKDEKGNLLGYVVRLEDKDKSKITPMLTYCKNDQGDTSWRWKGFVGTERPLYGLDHLALNPSAQVLVVEGEKTADVAQTIFKDHIVVTWSGGSSKVHLSDWAPLKGRDVTIWPDHDDPGKKAANTLQDILKTSHEVNAKVVELPSTLPHKWDLADPLPDGFSLEVIKGLITPSLEQAQNQDFRKSFEKMSFEEQIKQIERQQFDRELRQSTGQSLENYEAAMKAFKENYKVDTSSAQPPKLTQPTPHDEAFEFCKTFYEYKSDLLRNIPNDSQKEAFEKQIYEFSKKTESMAHLKTINADCWREIEQSSKHQEKQLQMQQNRNLQFTR